MTIGTRIITAPRGFTISCNEWPQEAALRMLMQATRAGGKNTFDIPGFVPKYVRPPKDIHVTDAKSHGVTVPMMH